jgi:hypothetical protein
MAKPRRKVVAQESELPALAALQPAAFVAAGAMPYAEDNRASAERAMTLAAEPKTLASFVRWSRWAAKQEPPFRLHTRETGEDGNPRMSPAFLAWLDSMSRARIACATDDDGYYRHPFRCAIFTLHGRDERSDNAALADFCLAVALSDEPLDRLASFVGLKPHWAVVPAAEWALRKLWNLYAPLRSVR